MNLHSIIKRNTFINLCRSEVVFWFVMFTTSVAFFQTCETGYKPVSAIILSVVINYWT